MSRGRTEPMPAPEERRIIRVTWPAEGNDVFTDEAAAGLVGQEVNMNAPDGSRGKATVIAAKVRDGGRSLSVTLDAPATVVRSATLGT